MRPLRALILCAMLVALPRGLRAQLSMVEHIFNNLDDAGAFWVYQGFSPTSSTLTAGTPGGRPKQSGLQGLGFGFTFHLSDIPTCRHRPHQEETRSVPASESPQVDHSCPKEDSIPTWRFELALIYSQVSGFHSRDPSFDLRGSIQELPRLSWFVLYGPGRWFSPYFGVHVGLLQMQNVAIIDSTGAYYPLGGNTYEVGVAVGGALLVKVGSEALQAFVEPGYTMRSFTSLAWNGQTKTIPARFPRGLRFTGWEVAAGLEVPVPHRGEGGAGANPTPH